MRDARVYPVGDLSVTPGSSGLVEYFPGDGTAPSGNFRCQGVAPGLEPGDRWFTGTFEEAQDRRVPAIVVLPADAEDSPELILR